MGWLRRGIGLEYEEGTMGLDALRGLEQWVVWVTVQGVMEELMTVSEEIVTVTNMGMEGDE